MLRPAQAGDEAAIEAFLAQHAETSMFLRGNLHEHGLFDRTNPRGTAFWIAGGQGVATVFGFSNAGFAMSQAPGADAELWQAFAEAVGGRVLNGITGAAAQVAQAKRAFGLHSAAFSLDAPEPLYRLALADLVVPDLPGAIRQPTQDDRSLLDDWHRAYVTELRMSPPERVAVEARERAARAIATGTARLLEVDGMPVAMTAVTARLPGMVQVGAVYTPPALRRRGHARRAVALHLDELRREGVMEAVLFASGAAARSAYESIGFTHIGTYSLAILKTPVTIGDRP